MSTRKPYEEDWALDGDGDVRRKNRRGDMTTLVCLKAATGELEAQALIAAAPDLARALLAHVRRCEGCGGSGRATLRTPAYDVQSDCPRCKGDRAALAKAGVPLP